MSKTKIAEDLLQIQAVKLSTDPPFTWSSGWRSPIYCDNRFALSFPAVRGRIRDAFVAEVQARYPGATTVVGVATGAIAWGLLVAEALELPFAYVRAKAKGHGMQNLIEGKVETGEKVVVIEDLVSTGGSSTAAVKALQAAGAEVLGTVAIFSYGFPEADAAFAATGTPFQALTSLEVLLAAATQQGYLPASAHETIMVWQKAPASWEG